MVCIVENKKTMVIAYGPWNFVCIVEESEAEKGTFPVDIILDIILLSGSWRVLLHCCGIYFGTGDQRVKRGGQDRDK